MPRTLKHFLERLKDPLGRLRLQVERTENIDAWPRTGKRVINMLLQAIPEKLKLELVASRKLSVTQIMFKILFCLFQRGGQSERASLLHLMADQKLATPFKTWPRTCDKGFGCWLGVRS